MGNAGRIGMDKMGVGGGIGVRVVAFDESCKGSSGVGDEWR